MFLRKPSFGLDISDYSIEVLQLNRQKKAVAFNRVLLDANIIKDGIILDKEKLIQKIKEVVFLARAKGSQVIMSLPESKIFTHIIELPKDLDEKELQSAITNESAKAIPIDMDDIYWDYQLIPSPVDDDNQYVFYVGTLKEILDEYLDVLDKVGLEPVAFEIESIALARAILKKKKLKNSVIIADIGARTTNISVFDKNGSLRLSSILPKAGFHFTKAIADKLKISLKEAEKNKRKYGLDEKKPDIKEALEAELQTISNELKKIIQYYTEDKLTTDRPKDLFLVGGTALTPKLVDYFAQQLNLRVEIGLSEIANQLQKKSILYNTVVGLALRGIGRKPDKSGINLLPLSLRPKPSFVDRKIRENKFFRIFGLLFGIFAVIILGWVVYTKYFKNTSPSSFEVIVDQPQDTEQPQDSEETDEPEDSGEESDEEEPEEEPQDPDAIGAVLINETETGWLNVREGPGTNYEIVTKIYPGESYPLLEEDGKWYKIKVDDEKVGYIFDKYASKEEAEE